MNKISTAFLLLCLMTFFACEEKIEKFDAKAFVNPFIGTGGHGHTFPGATLPFGMVQLSPDTRLDGWDGCSGYHNSDSIIYGFSHTHLSGTGVSDYGDVLLMPGKGTVHFSNSISKDAEASYPSVFKKETEVARPGYYEVLLEKHQIEARLTLTKRVGIHQYQFNSIGPVHVLIDLNHRDQLLSDSMAQISADEIVGHRISKAWAEKQRIYFSLKSNLEIDSISFDSTRKKAALHYTIADDPLMIKLAISAVSISGAQKNRKAEAPHWNFEEYLKSAENTWNDLLSKIRIEDQDNEKKTIFYTAMYHSFIAPNVFSDVDHQFRGMDKKVHQGKEEIHTVFSLWDTFRATHPLYNLLIPSKNESFIRTFMSQYETGGILPIWELAGNYTGCMIGYHSIPVIVDAYLKGNQNFDAEKALEAMVHSAKQNHLGLKSYKKKGFIAIGDESESVSKTLEYAYDDWCIAQMAEALEKDEIHQEFIQRAQNYRNIFNPENGFMQGKMNGAFSNGFDPAEVNFNFTEANSWQYSSFVPQDIQGLVDLYGGKIQFEKHLDLLFETEMVLSGRHQVDITGLIGQYAHGNEPSHHMAYLYNYIGKAHKSQERVNQIIEEMYQNAPDGLSGNEDCGQMSSWYVWSSLGMYPVSPGIPYYAIAAPQFESASIALENGKVFRVKTENGGEGNSFIQSAQLNGEEFNRTYITHEEITRGGELVFQMGKEANEDWGREDLPISAIANEDRTLAVPFLKSAKQTFSDSLQIELESLDDANIIYRLNGGEELTYEGPFWIKEDTQLEAIARIGAKESLPIKGISFKKIEGGRSISLKYPYNNQYNGGGDDALVNYLKGNSNFRTGYWQGFYGSDFSAIIDLGKEQLIDSIKIGALQDIKSWIWFPKKVKMSVAGANLKFSPVGELSNTFPSDQYGAFCKEFGLKNPNEIYIQYIKIEAENFGDCPSWHLGDGNPTWLFFDEVEAIRK